MRILITTDGSPYSEAALRLGAQLLRGHLVDEPPVILAVLRRESLRPRASEILASAQEMLGPTQALTKVRIGSPIDEIVHEAREGGYGLVLVGGRQGYERFNGLLRGSVAVCVAEQAPCPVLVAKGRIGPLVRILLCDSGAKSVVSAPPGVDQEPAAATRAWPTLLSRFTAQLAGMLEGEEEITVLHVMSQISAGPGVRGKQLRASAEELIQELAPEGELLASDLQILEQPGVRARPKVRHGLVLDEILAEARSGDYDLVVIGAHAASGWQALLLDNLAHELIVDLDRPVLIVR